MKMRRPGYLGQTDVLKPRATNAAEQSKSSRQQAINILLPPKTAEKTSKKADFPPGLVVSEQAKSVMAQKKAEIDNKEAKKVETIRVQAEKWLNRPDVLAKWQAHEARFQAKKQAILDKWTAKELQRQMQRKQLIDRLAAQGAAPAAIEAQNVKLAQEDTVEALNKAEELSNLETESLNEVSAREHNQVRNDKFYNFFAGFLGWQKRQIPV